MTEANYKEVRLCYKYTVYKIKELIKMDNYYKIYVKFYKGSDFIMKFHRYTVLLIFSFFTALTFSQNRLEVGYIYNESSNIDGYEKKISEYDLNNDGINEKVITFFKINGNKIDSYINIFIKENDSYRLGYQIFDSFLLNLSEMDKLNSKISKIKDYYQKISSGIQPNEIRYVNVYVDDNPEDLKMNLKYSKNSPKNLNNFIFIKSLSNLKSSPNDKADNLGVLKYTEKPELIFDLISSVNGKEELWYYVKNNNKEVITEGFLVGNKGIKRGFYWNEISSRINMINSFIAESNKNSKDLYVILAYVPLSKNYFSPVDKFGNRSTQSIKAYTNKSLEGEYINIPDQSLFRKLSETAEYIELETPFYGGPYYIKNNSKVYKKVSLNDKINRYIAIDTNSQSEVAVERNIENNQYEVITYSFVTTGKDNGYSSYDTPHGVFMVAHTRTYMMFTRNLKSTENIKTIPKRLVAGQGQVIAGEAPYAIRFSGGAYLHGVPGPIGASSAAKWYTASKIGTYKESHKCVRHYDDQIKFLFEWLSVENYNKDDREIPLKEDAIVFVL